MAAKKTKKVDAADTVHEDAPVDAEDGGGEFPVVGEAPAAGEAPSPRRPLARNVNIGGVWYGPAWGNADQYPDDWAGLRERLFEPFG